MVIEKIIVKKTDTILLADGVEYRIDADCIPLFHLHAGSELDDATLADLLTQSELLLCKKYLYDQIERYSKTEKGYREKLYQKGFGKNAVNHALAKAKELGYIDDGAFAQRYYERYKDKKGVIRIKNELKAKGISPVHLEFLKEEKSDDDSIFLLVEKFMRRRERTPEERVRAMRHLASKGFSYDEIVRAVNRYFRSDED